MNRIFAQFSAVYGGNLNSVKLYFAPGRVNLIGEHTDYNAGFVLPCAISYGTYLAVRLAGGGDHKFHSENVAEEATIPAGQSYVKTSPGWVNYPLGVIEMLQLAGRKVPGLEFYYSGDIPPSAGLSSSASIEMVTAFALNDLLDLHMSVMDLVKLSKKAENEFVGVGCGIMDQFAVGMGKADHALFLNCGTLNFNRVPLKLREYRLIIMNTGKVRGLTDSNYNERVAECNQAVTDMKPFSGFGSLGEMNTGDLENFGRHIQDETVFRRARHVISENRRVLEAVKALWTGDLGKFGILMNQSHESLRDDYEVTGLELDTMVSTALDQAGTIGARMTGAGFGGCAIALVKEALLEDFIFNVKFKYEHLINLIPAFYVPEIGSGVRRLF